MPYNSNQDLPVSIQKLPQSVQSKWRDAFNSAYVYALKHNLKNPEAYAFAVADAMLKKLGYRFVDGKWVRKNESTEHPENDLAEQDVILSSTRELCEAYRSQESPSDREILSMFLSLRGIKTDTA